MEDNSNQDDYDKLWIQYCLAHEQAIEIVRKIKAESDQKQRRDLTLTLRKIDAQKLGLLDLLDAL